MPSWNRKKHKNPHTITQAEVIEAVHYDPETGKFTRRRDGKALEAKGGKGYRRVSIAGCQFQAHWLAWFYVHGRWPHKELDHINGDRADNRIANLREATRHENGANRTLKTKTPSGFRGVYQCRITGKWFAKLVHKGRQIVSPLFERPSDAHIVWRLLASQYFGEFNREKT